MGNLLLNAGGLDGSLNWNAFGGAGVVSVDEATLGAAGRGVILSTGAATAAETVSLVSDGVNISSNASVEVFTYLTAPSSAVLAVQWFTNNPVALISQTPLSRVTLGQGTSRRGLPFTFDFASARLTPPAGATRANIALQLLVSSGANFQIGLLKPYLGEAPSWSRPTVWDPGSHTNPDLQLPLWPSILPPFQAAQLPTPLSNMASYASDTNISATRDLYTQLQYGFKGRMRLDAEQADALDQFYLNNRAGFFVVRPDTAQLCVGNWMDDGAPTPISNMGQWTIYEVGMRLAVT